MFIILRLDDSTRLQFIAHFKTMSPLRGWDSPEEAWAWAAAKWQDNSFAIAALCKPPSTIKQP